MTYCMRETSCRPRSSNTCMRLRQNLKGLKMERQIKNRNGRGVHSINAFNFPNRRSEAA